MHSQTVENALFLGDARNTNLMTKTLDFSYISDIAGENKEAFFNLLKIVSKNLNEYPSQIEQAFDARDWEEFRKLSHKFKSCTAYLNFPEFNNILIELEYAKEQNLPEAEIEDKILKMKSFALSTQEQVTAKMGDMLNS